jgi:hypothetical protein
MNEVIWGDHTEIKSRKGHLRTADSRGGGAGVGRADLAPADLEEAASSRPAASGQAYSGHGVAVEQEKRAVPDENEKERAGDLSRV